MSYIALIIACVAAYQAYRDHHRMLRIRDYQRALRLREYEDESGVRPPKSEMN